MRTGTILTILILVCATHLWAQDAPLGKSLRQQADEALIGGGQRPAAIDLYERWLAADPTDGDGWYNLACAYALEGEKQKALLALHNAVTAGWEDAAHTRQDSDLESLRTDQSYQQAIARMAERKQRRGIEHRLHKLVTETVGAYAVILPPDYEKEPERTYPVCVLLHGRGSTETGHGRLAEPLGRADVIYVAPRSLHPQVEVFTGAKRPGWTVYPPEWDHSKDYSAGLDPLDLHAAWIARCVQDVQRRYRTSGFRVYVWGHSQGAAAAHHFALRYPERVASFCAYAGYFPEPYQTAEALEGLKRYGVKAYYGHGKTDQVVMPTETSQVAQKLQKAGVKPSLIWFEGGHELSGEVVVWSRAWADTQIRRQRAAQPSTD